MGAILAILGEAGDPELGGRLQRMIECSPYRGEPEFLIEGPLAIGIQSMGWDASLHLGGNWLVAFHGYIGNWGELAPLHGWNFPEDANNAHKIAIAYEVLGNALFSKLRGEWAVMILDRRRGELLAARDVVGCRPMFRSENGGLHALNDVFDGRILMHFAVEVEEFILMKLHLSLVYFDAHLAHLPVEGACLSNDHTVDSLGRCAAIMVMTADDDINVAS